MVQARYIFENTALYIRFYLKFYKPSLNTYIVYKLYNTDIRVRIEKRTYNYQKCTLGRSLISVWIHNLPSICVSSDELNVAGTEVYV